MQSKEDLYRSEVRRNLAAGVSAMLTDFFYGTITETYYIAETIEGQLRITQVDQYSKLGMFLRAIAIFGGIFVFLQFIIPGIARWWKNYRKQVRLQLSRSDIIKAYEDIKANTLSIDREISEYRKLDVEKLLFSQEVFKQVNMLYTLFCPSNKMLEKQRRAFFRRGKTIDIIGSCISEYEYTVLLNTLEKLIKQFESVSEDEVLKSDIEESKRRIEKLRR